MRIYDLTRYPFEAPGDKRPALAVGWLGDSYDFPIAEPFSPFLEQLSALCRRPVDPTPRFEVCKLCGFDPSHGDEAAGGCLGYGVIRVKGLDGTIYAAPAMIQHFVRDHHYAPPAAFREAVMQYCRLCAGRLEARIEQNIQGLYCPACAEWDVVATYEPPITRAAERYTLTVWVGDPDNRAHVKAIAALTGDNYLKSRDRLRACPVIRFRAQALDLMQDIMALDAAGLEYTVEPPFPYTQPDADASRMLARNRRRFIGCNEVEAPSVAEDGLLERLSTPETYPGLAPKPPDGRILLLTRRWSSRVSSAYALFREERRWLLRRIEVGWTRSVDGWASPGGFASFGADMLVEPADANEALSRAKRLRRLGAPKIPSMIDGPIHYEVQLGAEVFRYASPDPAFEGESATIDEMISELDRLLPPSTLRRELERP